MKTCDGYIVYNHVNGKCQFEYLLQRYRMSIYDINLRVPLKIHFGGQANLFDSDLRQTKAALASTKADLSSLSEIKNLLLAAQKQLLEPPLRV